MQRGHFLCPSRRRNPLCRYTVDKFIATFFNQFHPFSLIAPRFRICSSKNVLFGLSDLESPSFWNFWCILSMSNLWRHVGANLRIFTHIKYQRHQVIRRVTKRPLNQQRSLQMLNCIRIAWISRNWHTLKVFHHFWMMTFWLIFEVVSIRILPSKMLPWLNFCDIYAFYESSFIIFV